MKNKKELQSQLLQAIHAGDAKTLRVALDQGVDVRSLRSRHGGSPLALAARQGSAECVAMLIEAGANLNGDDGAKWSAAHWAAATGAMECLQLLMKAGVDWSARDGLGSSPLAQAVWQGQTPAALFLIDQGAPLDLRDQDGHSAAMVASLRGHAKILARLIEAGADLSLRNHQGKTAFDLASSHPGLQSLVQMALDQRALKAGAGPAGLGKAARL